MASISISRYIHLLDVTNKGNQQAGCSGNRSEQQTFLCILGPIWHHFGTHHHILRAIKHNSHFGEKHGGKCGKYHTSGGGSSSLRTLQRYLFFIIIHLDGYLILFFKKIVFLQVPLSPAKVGLCHLLILSQLIMAAVPSREPQCCNIQSF